MVQYILWIPENNKPNEGTSITLQQISVTLRKTEHNFASEDPSTRDFQVISLKKAFFSIGKTQTNC